MPLLRRLLNLFNRSQVDSEIDAELRSHLAMRTEDNLAAGMTPNQARRDALTRFGNPTLAKERVTEADAALEFDGLWLDLRYALRQLRKSPIFAVTVVVTLALGIGSNTAIFSVVDAVLRHPAGVDHPERVIAMHTRYTKFTLDVPYVSVPAYDDAAKLPELVEAAAIALPANFNISRDDRAEHIAAARVSWQWFRVFGAQTILGRTFTAGEDQPNARPVVVLSYGIWQRAYGGEKNVIGETMLLDQKPYRIIGVMRSDFAWPRRFEIWVPIALPPAAFTPDEFFNENYPAMIRLRPGVSMQQLNAALSTKMWNELRRDGGSRYATSSGWSVYGSQLTQFAAGPLRKPLYLLLAVVVLVLLIASANVAGLFLARSSARRNESSVQLALGASIGRLIRQLSLEILLLGAIACIAGSAAGPLTGTLLLRIVPHDLADGFTVKVGPGVLIFTFLTALLTLVIAGMGPAYQIMRRREQLQVREGGRSTTASKDRQGLRSAFVIGEVATAFLLLTGTGLFLNSLLKLQKIEPGFSTQGVVTGKVDFAGENLKSDEKRQAMFVRGVVEHLAAQPGVRAAAAVDPLPFDPDGFQSCSFGITGRPLRPGDPGPHSQLTYATPDYLKVMRISLLAGRWIDAADTAASEPVAVIDARLAQKYWPGQNPIGQRISFGCSNQPSLIVGEVATIRLTSLEEDTSDGMRYYSYAQGTNIMADFLVRSDGDPPHSAQLIEQAVSDIDRSQAVTTVSSLDTLVGDSLAGRRLIVWMLIAFAVLSLLLTMVGIYGLISYITAQRTREIGIRMALGAQRGLVVRLVLEGTLARVGIGLVIGTILSVGATMLLKHVFADFGGGVATSFGLAAAVLLAVGAVAGLAPAMRAGSIDPMRALRAE